MGFYAPAQIVRDARDHGVEVRPVCINASRWDCTLEPTDAEDRLAVRLGLRMVKGVLFVTIEDETGLANLVVWPQVFERQRRVILAAGMIGVQGRIQREGEVARQLTDLSPELASVGDRDIAFPLPHGRGDEFHHGTPALGPRSMSNGPKPRDIEDPYRHLDQIRVRTRNFR